MTIAEFWRLRAQLLEEVRYKNFLESNIMGDFQLVNHDGEIEAETDGDTIVETDLVSSFVLRQTNKLIEIIVLLYCLLTL